MKNKITENVSRETLDKLKLYEQLLVKWQKTINIVSHETIENAWSRHFIDSLQLCSILDSETKKLSRSEKCNVLDVGSGGGFPGMVIAITGDYNVTCVDSDKRKMLFLSEVARQTHTNVSLLDSRIEDLSVKDFDVVTARGFSSLDKLLEIVYKYTNDGIGVFLKGKKIEQEMAKARMFFDFEYELQESITDNSGCIVITQHVRPVD